MDYNEEEFTLDENIKVLSKIQSLISELIVLESHLDDCSLWFKDTPLRNILMYYTVLQYSTYKNKVDIEFNINNKLNELAEQVKKALN